MPATYEIKRAANGQFYFNLKAANGQVILTSEMYKAKSSALNGIESIRKNCANDARYEKRTASDNQPYFVLKAANHEVIGKSETYTSEEACDNGIAAVKKAGAGAAVVDHAAAGKS